MTIRVRFAPSPTGMMHLGNVRTALINFLFAKQKEGTFVLRIEDTDAQRMLDPEAKKILEDLAWLNLTYDEGPIVEGPHAPYFQSQRAHLYEETRRLFEQKHLIYRCFCTEEELAKKRERQIALKLPPRYDRTCMALNEEQIAKNTHNNIPFIWRFKLNHERSVTITDLAHGSITFELSNFSDFPISRQDGSFTFMFANFVDDYLMNITHIFRGEDHLSNTANQAAMFDALNISLPMYWHMPILCNTEGKKLSKRDFGFSLRDLKEAGFLPEAVSNYVGIIGSSFTEEVMSLEELTKAFNFESIHSAGRITYDLEKLKWVNKQWIARCTLEKLLALCRPLLEKEYPQAQYLNDHTLTQLLRIIQTELVTINDVTSLLQFYFVEPTITREDFLACISEQHYTAIKEIITAQSTILAQPADYNNQIKIAAKTQNIPLKELFWFLRLALMGTTHGPSIHELLEMLEYDKAQQRIEKALHILS